MQRHSLAMLGHRTKPILHRRPGRRTMGHRSHFRAMLPRRRQPSLPQPPHPTQPRRPTTTLAISALRRKRKSSRTQPFRLCWASSAAKWQTSNVSRLSWTKKQRLDHKDTKTRRTATGSGPGSLRCGRQVQTDSGASRSLFLAVRFVPVVLCVFMSLCLSGEYRSSCS